MEKKKIRILFPDRLDKPVGGLSIVAQKIKKYLSDDFDLEFVGHPQEVEMENYLPAFLPLNIQHGPLNTITGQISFFAQALKNGKPDLIHAFDWTVFLAGAYTAAHYEIPLVSSMQLSINKLNIAGIGYAVDQTTVDGHWINETHKQIEIAGLNHANKIIHVSNDYFKGFDLYKDKSVIIQNGVDFDELQGDKIELPGTRPIKLVYIGRFATMKNVLALTKATIPDNIDLIYIGNNSGGEGYIYDSMLKHVEENDNVHYIGEKYGKEKADIFTSADAVIFPSNHEPFGIVGLEAMATNCVLLTSRVDGISDYANNSNSIYCGLTTDSINISLKLLSLLDDDTKQSLLQNGLETAHEFNWVRATDKYREVYNELLGN